MPKPQISVNEINLIVSLRKSGYTLAEIKSRVPRGKSTIFKYIRDVKTSPKFEEVLQMKRKGSTNLSVNNWGKAQVKAKSILGNLSKRDKFLILAILYWGEGNKKEFNLINSDPSLVKVVFDTLIVIGVPLDDIKVSLRLYSDLPKKRAIQFWIALLNIKTDKILSVDVLDGKKRGKLAYGMCRLRIRKGGEYFKLMMSMIDLVRAHFNAAVVQRIEQDTPNV